MEIWIWTGIIMARAPTLFIKADATATSRESEKICSKRLLPRFMTHLPSKSTTPEHSSAFPITSTAAIVITAGCPKPMKASSGTTIPKISNMLSEISATKSWRMRPYAKSNRANTNTPKTI